jgi:hypothetical protein
VRISRTCIDTSYTRGRSRAERYTIPTMHLIIEAENVFLVCWFRCGRWICLCILGMEIWVYFFE